VEEVVAPLTEGPNHRDVAFVFQLPDRLLNCPIRQARFIAEGGNGRVASAGRVVVVPCEPVGNVLCGVVGPDEPEGFLHLNAHGVKKATFRSHAETRAMTTRTREGRWQALSFLFRRVSIGGAAALRYLNAGLRVCQISHSSAIPASNGTSSYLLFLEFAPSVAVALTERLSVGATMFIGDGYVSGPFVGVSNMTNAYALRGGVGIHYLVGDATRLGAYYHSTQAFRFPNEATLLGQARPIDIDMGLPQTAGMGISNESLMDGKLLLAADALFLDWDSAALFKSIYKPQWVMQLGSQYRATDRLKLRAGYAFAENPIDDRFGTSIGPVPEAGGSPAVRYVKSQSAIVNEHRLSGGFGYSGVIPGLDFDAFAGGMFPATEFLGNSTRVDICSYWAGVGFTWHFDRSTPRPSPDRS
jgi:hypothetical protein